MPRPMTEEERKRRMLQHIQEAQRVIGTGNYPNWNVMRLCMGSGLRSMLEAMCGLGDYANEVLENDPDFRDFPVRYPSVFDPEVTEAIRSLLAAFDEQEKVFKLTPVR